MLTAVAVDKAGLKTIKTFTFTVTAAASGDLIDLVCPTSTSHASTTSSSTHHSGDDDDEHGGGSSSVCKDLRDSLSKAQAYQSAHKISQRDAELRKFLVTGANEVGKSLTAAQMAILVQIVQSFGGI